MLNLQFIANNPKELSLCGMLNDWYNGKLDSWFYYREQNDQMLLDYLETVSSPEELLCETETNEMDL